MRFIMISFCLYVINDKIDAFYIITSWTRIVYCKICHSTDVTCLSKMKENDARCDAVMSVFSV